MAVDWAQRALPNMRGLTPYQPGQSRDALGREQGIARAIKLASNENPRGPGPQVRAIIAQGARRLQEYPDAYEFAAKLGGRLGVASNRLCLGNGSNDVLDLVARVFLGAGRSAVVSEYCFLVYPLVVALTGARLKTVPAVRYGHDLDAMLQAIDETTAVVFIANPNNPTGTWATQDQLERFLAQVPEEVVVVLDEAYCDYVLEPTYPDGMALLARHDNLILTRTFSKVYGLAGARIGYSLSNAELADLLNRARQPFNTNSLALSAAAAALEDGQYVKDSVRLNHAGMAQVQAGLQKLQLDYIPSVGNFISFDAISGRTGGSANELYQKMQQAGVIVRPLANYQLPDHLRVSIGMPEDNEAFLQALAQALQGQGRA